ncbi:TetR/AcrR family transcriptional regulator [Amycolatopsis acidiphila]|uniref:TetR/AcrR family transcriptional regulator n=1 Tax=Amycolatopsis acidiphila TaxID=715473 RepID=A0A558AB35_9PSEU|nr:TetR/AcrR family transcriptional regulator [Amycolatopsis acidiphila]TVT21463.1 TetR/AcrR family transcriptional regulator [Amycolatopsis acidiphila]UIJ63140.1 TetR/AcrR family transcriptional regulator [Amycolatopsis acidiphila]GHG73969.1 TetR family transcriptional regulator [Amycolatopsis acidiphila]
MPVDVPEESRIIDAAYRCLAQSDGEGVSMTDILGAAGLSTRAFYRHFESKDALLLAMFRRDSDRLHAELDAAARSAASPAEALRTWIEGYLRLTAQPRRRQRVLMLSSAELLGASGYAEARAQSMRQLQEHIAGILRQGQADGSFPWTDPEADARAVRAILTEAFSERMSRSARTTAADAAEQVTDFAFRALGAGKRG